jgi:hypothetical protein
MYNDVSIRIPLRVMLNTHLSYFKHYTYPQTFKKAIGDLNTVCEKAQRQVYMNEDAYGCILMFQIPEKDGSTYLEKGICYKLKKNNIYIPKFQYMQQFLIDGTHVMRYCFHIKDVEHFPDHYFKPLNMARS